MVLMIIVLIAFTALHVHVKSSLPLPMVIQEPPSFKSLATERPLDNEVAQDHMLVPSPLLQPLPFSLVMLLLMYYTTSSTTHILLYYYDMLCRKPTESWLTFWMS